MAWRPLFEAIGVLALACAGAGLGFLSARLSPPWKRVALIVPFLLLLSVAAGYQLPRLQFVPPISWVMADRNELLILALSSSMLFCALCSCLQQKRLRNLLLLLMVIAAYYPVSYFFEPVLCRRQLAQLETHYDPQGICLQSTDYTCVPAAAVTALRRLGLSGDEGELAILARTGSGGTAADTMCRVLNERYQSAGLICRYRYFSSLDELRHCPDTLASVRFGPMEDHCVAVLDVTDSEVVLGDPLSGLKRISRAEFIEIWRSTGITFERVK